MTETQTSQAKVKGVVDIVFLLDITGSMQHCIDAMKQNIASFIDFLTTKNANNQTPVKHWRAKVVGFRDFEEDGEPYVDHPFVEDADALKAQLNSLAAQRGGDEPESLLEALYKVATMGQSDKGAGQFDANKWRYRGDAARVVIVFTDASYKEKMVQPPGGTFEDVVNACHGNRLILSIFAPQMDCYDKLSAIDKSEYNAIDIPEGKSAQEALSEFTRDQNNFKKTMAQLAKSVSQSAVVTL